MTTRAQHLTIRVSDSERSVAFYEALGARKALRRYVTDKDFTKRLFGLEETEYTMQYLELPDGFGLELIQFLPSPNQTFSRPQQESGFMHFAVYVDDFAATIARLESAGFEPPAHVGAFGSLTASFTYLSDPDGHAIELNDAPWSDIVVATQELHPEAAL
ncbi:VOC family protein [Microbacterium sp. NPDC089696]|uniref:VOC family protein n=1 Tax=Microbacterium sp. NPDC089696 TaxID=3364199 RepID=UPI00381870D6